jgi:hypothetical protein
MLKDNSNPTTNFQPYFLHTQKSPPTTWAEMPEPYKETL